MCYTNIIFERACGHAVQEILRCPDSRRGTCTHLTDRMVRAAICNECQMSPWLIPGYEEREANYRQFNLASLDAIRNEIREVFSMELGDGHVLASIDPSHITHNEARSLVHEREYILNRMYTRRLNPGVDRNDRPDTWYIERLDDHYDDHNRAMVLGAAILRVPENILRGFTLMQLRDHIDSMEDEIEQINEDLQDHTARLHDARQLLAANDVVRAQAVKTILTKVDIAGLSDNDQSCIICSDDLGVAYEDHLAEEACSLPCGHIMGRSCITKWLEEKATCPVCRRDYNDELSVEPVFVENIRDEIEEAELAAENSSPSPSPSPSPVHEIQDDDGAVRDRYTNRRHELDQEINTLIAARADIDQDADEALRAHSRVLARAYLIRHYLTQRRLPRENIALLIPEGPEPEEPEIP